MRYLTVKKNYKLLNACASEANFRAMLLLIGLFILLLSGCNSVSQRLEYAQKVASSAQMQQEIIPSSEFKLTTYHKSPVITTDANSLSFSPDSGPLYVYLEGDGFAFIDRYTVSSNPTPRSPVALELSAIHQKLYPQAKVLYIARPCQYTPLDLDSRCESVYWSQRRLAPEVIKSTNEVINTYLKRLPLTKHVVLIGFSGGGALALLIATQRSDVIQVISVAGNIDLEAFLKHHKLSEMTGSLNPTTYWEKLQYIPQLHLVGKEDTVIPVVVAQSYLRHFKDSPASIKIQEFSASHNKGWNLVWPKILPHLSQRDSREGIQEGSTEGSTKGLQKGLQEAHSQRTDLIKGN